jgi:hypothetical protein
MTKPVVSLGQSQAKMVVAWTPRDADRTESLIAAHATCKKKTFFKIKPDRRSLIINSLYKVKRKQAKANQNEHL